MFVCSLLLGFACSLWAKPGREFYASDIRESMEKGDKLAILMVHFGSAYPEARTQVLDVMNKRVKEAFPDVEVRQAYSARSESVEGARCLGSVAGGCLGRVA